jgi:DNA (cytosine-5)-methyltransferase 1
MNKKPNYIDLFAGAGGLSEGFIRAGFNPVAHVEMNKYACETLKTRTSYHYLKEKGNVEVYYKYLKNEISREDLWNVIPANLINSVINKEITNNTTQEIFTDISNLLNNKKVDLIIGGPPCQAYSLIGRARDPNSMKYDPRNFLYKLYVKFLKKYIPKLFVFENVPGILSANNGDHLGNIVKEIEKAGYTVKYKTLNAKDFGVLQNRKRVILIGWLKNLDKDYPEFETEANNWQIMKDLFSDLPNLIQGSGKPFTSYKKNATKYLELKQIRNGQPFTTQHIARPHNDRDLEIYKTAIKLWLNNKKRLNYTDLPSNLKTHRNEIAFQNRFQVVDPQGCSHTVVAHISCDGHYYIYPDLDQIRSISVREAARIQSFPDDFFFEGGRTAAFKQIGNAVPPLMAEGIAHKIKDMII